MRLPGEHHSHDRTHPSIQPTSIGAAAPSIWIARTLWGVVTLLVAVIFITMLPTILAQMRYEWSVQEAMNAAARWLPFSTYVLLVVAINFLVGGVYAAAGLIIFWRRSDDSFAVFVSATLIMLALFVGVNGKMSDLRLPPPLMALVPWLPALLSAATLASFLLLLFLFPNGHFVPRSMRWIAIVLVGLIGLVSLATVSASGRALSGVALAGSSAPIRRKQAGCCFSWTLLIGFLGGLAAQVYRYRRETDPQRRQQTKWVAWGLSAPLLACCSACCSTGSSPSSRSSMPSNNLLFPLIMTLIPLSILFSILRYRLWDIDLCAQSHAGLRRPHRADCAQLYPAGRRLEHVLPGQQSLALGHRHRADRHSLSAAAPGPAARASTACSTANETTRPPCLRAWGSGWRAQWRPMRCCPRWWRPWRRRSSCPMWRWRCARMTQRQRSWSSTASAQRRWKSFPLLYQGELPGPAGRCAAGNR